MSFSTAGCGNKMAVSVTGPRAVNELGGPVIPGTFGSVVPTMTYLDVLTHFIFRADFENYWANYSHIAHT